MHLDERGEPVWRDGDVARIRFKHKDSSLTDEYTYVREDGHWPGESFWSTHDDAVMTTAWHENRASVMVMASVDTEEAEWPNQHIEPGKNGVWIVYTPVADVVKNVAVFLDELEARRWADLEGRAALGAVVGFIAWGQPLAEVFPDKTPQF